jgi:hypothetical protein
MMETILSLCLGLGLSAACGFRVFVPLVVVSVASLTGHLHLAEGFQWIGTYPALVAVAAATLIEIAAYYIPWVDNILDTIATPAAVIAGTLITAAQVVEISPFLKWSLALIAGGGAAGIVQSATVFLRGASSMGTGGIANPLVATGELAGSLITSFLGLLVPVLAALLVLMVAVVVGVRLWRGRATPGTKAASSSPA